MGTSKTSTPRSKKRRRGIHVWWKCRLMITALTLTCAGSQDISTCCDKASGTCRSVCEKMSLTNMTSDSSMKGERILNVHRFCSPELVEFWICMNHTIQEVMAGSDWWGRACCSLGRSPSCRRACAGAYNASALTDACRRSDEIAFFDCVRVQDNAQACCSNTQSTECHDACQDVLWRVGLSHVEASGKERVEETCEQSPHLMHCFRDLTASTVHVDTAKYLPCCQMSSDPKCRSSCEDVLQRTGEFDEIAEVMGHSCGAPAIGDKLWQCFLRKDAPPEHKEPIPQDIVKLHCCIKATSENCKKLCFSNFNLGFQTNNWQKFYSECLGDPQESELSQCIEEVDSPCSFGCSGLTYCSQLNNRPTTLFRSCSAQADLNAHLAVAENTGSGFITVSGLKLPLKNSTLCSSDVWKNVACALHVKPCTVERHSSLLCMSDCLALVSSCVAWPGAQAAQPALSAAALCARLAPAPPARPAPPAPPAPCVPLQQYMKPSIEPPILSAEEAVTSPCSGAVCNASQMCVINRNCLQGASCRRYKCVDGCPLGDRSSVVVCAGCWARVPTLPAAGAGGEGGARGSYRLCACGARGLAHCQPLPAAAPDYCAMHDTVYSHGERFWMECNLCVCWMGERVCARRLCGGARARLTRLPCNCAPHHVPVTAKHRHYPNACLAKCAGAAEAEIEFVSRDGCAGRPCGGAAPCLPAPRVCLSRLQHSCPQHVCVDTSNCASQPSSPVCDSDGRTHTNACFMFMAGSKFAYWGECLMGCSNIGTVCGYNGISYPSECAAWAEYVSVDYRGPCVAVGPISDDMAPKCLIDRVICPALKKQNCTGFTAPGACCPRCGGGLRILYSKKQIDRALYGTNISASVIHLKNLLTSLDRHVKIAECALRGYLSIELEIFVSVESILPNPTNLQLEMCVLEAEKLQDLINRESALISSDLNLSALAYALTVHKSPSNGINSTNIICPLFLFILYFVTFVLR